MTASRQQERLEPVCAAIAAVSRWPQPQLSLGMAPPVEQPNHPPGVPFRPDFILMAIEVSFNPLHYLLKSREMRECSHA